MPKSSFLLICAISALVVLAKADPVPSQSR